MTTHRPPKPGTKRALILKLFDSGAFKRSRDIAEAMNGGGVATRQQVRYVITTLHTHRPDWQRKLYGEDWWAACQQAEAARKHEQQTAAEAARESHDEPART